MRHGPSRGSFRACNGRWHSRPRHRVRSGRCRRRWEGFRPLTTFPRRECPALPRHARWQKSGLFCRGPSESRRRSAMCRGGRMPLVRRARIPGRADLGLRAWARRSALRNRLPARGRKRSWPRMPARTLPANSCRRGSGGLPRERHALFPKGAVLQCRSGMSPHRPRLPPRSQLHERRPRRRVF